MSSHSMLHDLTDFDNSSQLSIYANLTDWLRLADAVSIYYYSNVPL
jgi:hypothetical protein